MAHYKDKGKAYALTAQDAIDNCKAIAHCIEDGTLRNAKKEIASLKDAIRCMEYLDARNTLAMHNMDSYSMNTLEEIHYALTIAIREQKRIDMLDARYE